MSDIKQTIETVAQLGLLIAGAFTPVPLVATGAIALAAKESPELYDLFQKWIRGEELTPEEKTKARALADKFEAPESNDPYYADK